VRVEVFARGDLPELREALTAAERAALDRLGLAGGRAREWIAGRCAARRVLGGGADVLVADDGAPHVAGSPVAASLSHDGAWVAVACGTGGVAVDLCARAHAPRLPRVLARLGVEAREADPCLVFAALECALKLRRRGVWSLLEGGLSVEGGGDRALVRGVGDDVRVGWRATGDYALAWACEGAP
jgi:hypothetical protein